MQDAASARAAGLFETHSDRARGEYLVKSRKKISVLSGKIALINCNFCPRDGTTLFFTFRENIRPCTEREKEGLGGGRAVPVSVHVEGWRHQVIKTVTSDEWAPPPSQRNISPRGHYVHTK